MARQSESRQYERPAIVMTTGGCGNTAARATLPMLCLGACMPFRDQNLSRICFRLRTVGVKATTTSNRAVGVLCHRRTIVYVLQYLVFLYCASHGNGINQSARISTFQLKNK